MTQKPQDPRDTPQMKMAHCTVFLLLAAIYALLKPSPWTYLSFAAAVCSYLGDALLAGWPAVLKRIPNGFVAGGVSFLIAHVLYAAASASLLTAAGVPVFAVTVPWIAFAALSLLHPALFARGEGTNAALAAAMTCYLLFVSTMAALAFRVCAVNGVWLLPLGGALFFVSDWVLLQRILRGTDSFIYTLVVMGTYLAAQILLQTGIFLC